MKKRTYGTGSVRSLDDSKWLLRYTPKNSKRLGKVVEAPNRKAAEDELTAWRKELDGQQNPGVKVPCSHLLELHLATMRRMQRDPKNILDQEKKIKKHLTPFFGSREASTVKLSDINRYIDLRLAKGARPATINRELSNLRRAFNCGVKEHVISNPLPKYDQLPENNVREGFLEHDVYRRIMNYLPRHQHMLWCFAYYLGIRKGELLKFRWEWLLPYWKQKEPIVKIPGKYTKNKKPHTIPIYHPEMRAMVEIALTQRDPKCSHLFQYRGRQLKSIRTGFEAARVEAGLSELIFHDTRRTAVRNMVLAGIPEKRAMQISGHRTRSVFDRYDIATERDAIETGKHMRKHWEQLAEQQAQAADERLEQEKLGNKSGNWDLAPSPPEGEGLADNFLN